MTALLHKIISLHSPQPGARVASSLTPWSQGFKNAMLGNFYGLNLVRKPDQKPDQKPVDIHRSHKKEGTFGFSSENTEEHGIFFPSNSSENFILNTLRYEKSLESLKQGDWIQVTTKSRSFKAVKQADGTFSVASELSKDILEKLAKISKELEGNKKVKSGQASAESIEFLLETLNANPDSKLQIKAIVEKINHRTYKTGLTANLTALFEALGMPLPKITATINGETYNLGKKTDMGDGKTLYYITSGGEDEHESRLGRGGFGYVRLAVLVTNDGQEKLVAVKKIEDKTQDKEIINEIKMLQYLRAKEFTSAPEYHGDFTDEKASIHGTSHNGYSEDRFHHKLGQKKCIVMDYIPGQDLQQKLELGNVTMKEKIPLLTKLFDLLEQLHAKAVVHQDIKLENIKINENGELVLLDFASSYMVGSEQFDDVCTPGYAAPELRDQKPSSVKSDVYAMAVLMMGVVLEELPVYPSHMANISLLKDIQKAKLEITTSNEEFGFLDKKTSSEDKFYNLLSQMMDANPDKRPSAFHAKRDWLEILAGQELSE